MNPLNFKRAYKAPASETSYMEPEGIINASAGGEGDWDDQDLSDLGFFILED